MLGFCTNERKYVFAKQQIPMRLPALFSAQHQISCAFQAIAWRAHQCLVLRSSAAMRQPTPTTRTTKDASGITTAELFALARGGNSNAASK
ncbi:MAG: hypothetical protein EAZ92_01155 [Candidatus Kapaibacterium sp.]|nr:MAG: hypothetical protein EAZ92_01155 [Candidatus Kapabacteria bacterium]